MSNCFSLSSTVDFNFSLSIFFIYFFTVLLIFQVLSLYVTSRITTQTLIFAQYLNPHNHIRHYSF